MGNRRLQLGAEDFVRLMSIGTNWQKIRIGMRLAFNDPLARLYNSSFVAGVCRGTQYPFGNPLCTDFIGVGWPAPFDGSSLAIGTTSGLTLNNYDSVQFSKLLKVGSALTQTSVTNNYTYMSRDPATNMSPFMLDIAKGSPNYTLTYWFQTQAQFTTMPNVSRAVFLSMMECEITAPYVTSSAQTQAYNGLGLFDSVNVRWGRSTPTVEIHDLVVYQYY